MDPLSQILAGLEAAWWLLWSVPAMPLSEDPTMQTCQLLCGTAGLLLAFGLMLTRGP